VAVGTPALALGAASAGAAAAQGSAVAVLKGPWGPMLIAGSGQSAGTALYFVTSDNGTSYGCTTAKVSLGHGQPYQCTGAETDHNAEWPAYTTTGTPVAGPGVSQSMLGEVARPGIGEQVTYDGHPLYLFDNVPGLPGGEGWDEPTLPPVHGAWWLLSPSGIPLGWEGTLTTTMIGGHRVLASFQIDGGGFAAFPVYTYSGGTSCTGACAAKFSPLYAQGRAGVSGGLPGRGVGLVTRADGSTQRTWGGKPLYLYGGEIVAPGPQGVLVRGNGNGVKLDGGTFSLVSP
jgi:predicted lipoprotein with Yx(FWY)xxD motif